MENKPKKIASILEYHNEILDILAPKVRKFSPMLFEKDGSNDFHHLASSMLLKFNEHYFLNTAAHVKTIRQGNYEFWTTYEEDFIKIRGKRTVNAYPHPTRKNDRVDMAIIKLTDSCVSDLIDRGYNFFDLKNVNVDHPDLTDLSYHVVGYPTTKVKKKYIGTDEYEASVLYYQTRLETDKKLVTRLDLFLELNLMLKYQRKKIYKSNTLGRVTGPKPEGLSGAGIWCFPTFVTGHLNIDLFPLYPIGFVIEHDNSNNILIGTRLAVITECIRKKFDSSIQQTRRFIVP